MVSPGWKHRSSTVVVRETVLFAGIGSGLELVTDAVLVRTAGPAVLTTTSIVASVPAIKFPRLQLTVGPPVQVPWLGVAETNVTPAGRGSVNITVDMSVAPASTRAV